MTNWKNISLNPLLFDVEGSGRPGAEGPEGVPQRSPPRSSFCGSTLIHPMASCRLPLKGPLKELFKSFLRAFWAHFKPISKLWVVFLEPKRVEDPFDTSWPMRGSARSKLRHPLSSSESELDTGGRSVALPAAAVLAQRGTLTALQCTVDPTSWLHLAAIGDAILLLHLSIPQVALSVKAGRHLQLGTALFQAAVQDSHDLSQNGRTLGLGLTKGAWTSAKAPPCAAWVDSCSWHASR